MNSPHKGPVTQKMFPFDDVIMESQHILVQPLTLFFIPTDTPLLYGSGVIQHVPWQGLYMVCKSRWKSQKLLKNETIKYMPYYLYIACLLHNIPLIIAICNTEIEIIIQISNHLGGCFKVSFSHRHPLIVIIYTKQSYHASTGFSQ